MTESVKESFQGMLWRWREVVHFSQASTARSRACANDAQQLYDRLVALAEQWRIDSDTLGPSDCADQLTELLQGGQSGQDKRGTQ